MSKYNFLVSIIKHEAIINEIRDSNGNLLYDYINKKYININLDYKTINNLKLFKKELNEYKTEKKIENVSTKDLKKIINIKSICSKINIYANYYFKRNKSLHEH